MTYFVGNHVPSFISSRRTKASVRMFLWLSSHSGHMELHFWAICTSFHLLSCDFFLSVHITFIFHNIDFMSCTLHYSCSSRRWKDMKKNEQMCQKVIIVFSFSLRFVGTKCCLNQHYGATSWKSWDYTHVLFSFCSLFVPPDIGGYIHFSDFHMWPDSLSFMSGFNSLFCLAWIRVSQLVTDLHIRWTLSLTFALYSLPM